MRNYVGGLSKIRGYLFDELPDQSKAYLHKILAEETERKVA